MPFNFFRAKRVPAVEKVEPAPAEALADPPAEVVPPEPTLPVSEPKVEGQLDTLKVTREDVIAAYKMFLGRLPESMEVVTPRVGVAPLALLVDFLASKEFLDDPKKAQLVLAVAKKILDERQAQAARQQAEAQGLSQPSDSAPAPADNA